MPNHHLVFSLNQRNILLLLTGTNLYSNQYACLRELYQNALDEQRRRKDRQGIIIRTYDEGDVTRLIVNEVEEHSYYASPSRGDLEERLLSHGMLVEVYLKEGCRKLKLIFCCLNSKNSL